MLKRGSVTFTGALKNKLNEKRSSDVKEVNKGETS